MKKYIRNYFKSPLSKESLLKYAEMMKQTYRSFGLSSSPVKVKIMIALVAISVSLFIAFLRGLIS